MNRNRLTQIVAALVLLASLAGAALLVPPIAQQRKELQLAGLGIENGADLPPKEILAGAALGMFRGLAVDVLWYRINELKEQGKFYEINQLAQAITTLQPRFPQVWGFHAHNMAYNISVMTHTPDERWDWVNKGIALLRDKGIPYNPRAIRLYRELDWIFYHKVGQFSDDMCWYYKQRLAREWQEILGAPTEGATKEQAVAAMKKIADAPETLAELKLQSPEVVPLLEELRKQGHAPDTALVQKIGQIMMVTSSTDAALMGVSLASLPEAQRQFAQALRDPKLAPGVEPLLAHLRKRALIDHYHMDPAFMVEIMELFGPLDWRHPASHSAYWNTKGMRMAAHLRNKKDIDLLNTYRGCIHAMQELMFRGRIGFDPISGALDLMPDPRFIEAYETAKFTAEEELFKTGLYDRGVSDNFNAGHENFLLTAVVFCYLYGEVEQAQKYYDRARQLYALKPDNLRSGRYMQNLESMVMNELASNWDLSAYSRQFIDSMLVQAFAQGLAHSRQTVFDRFMNLAESGYKTYVKQSVSAINPGMSVQNRRGFLPWDKLVLESYISYCRQPSLSPLARYRLWSNTPDAIRRPAFDRLKEPMRLAAAQAGLDPEKAFPEPPGMEQYRKEHPVPLASEPSNKKDESSVETERR